MFYVCGRCYVCGWFYVCGEIGFMFVGNSYVCGRHKGHTGTKRTGELKVRACYCGVSSSNKTGMHARVCTESLWTQYKC